MIRVDVKILKFCLLLMQCLFFPGIEGFASKDLKPTETKEKVILPAPEDIQAEKTHQGLIQGVESFASDKLNPVKTREPQSPTATLQVNSYVLIISLYCSRTYWFKTILRIYAYVTVLPSVMKHYNLYIIRIYHNL